MAATPQERLALGVATLLLVAGVGVRALSTEPVPSELSGAAAAEASVASLTAEVRDSVTRAARRRQPLAAGERIDPSTAPLDELVRLPRVGPSLAARIVAWREERGPFRTLDDLAAVPGVGPAILRDAGPHLALPPGEAGASRPPFRTPADVADWSAGEIAGARLDPNTATAAELATLPGIGPALAGRIVASREEHGPFRSVEDLRRVAGIGPKVLERLRPRVVVRP